MIFNLIFNKDLSALFIEQNAIINQRLCSDIMYLFMECAYSIMLIRI